MRMRNQSEGREVASTAYFCYRRATHLTYAAGRRGSALFELLLAVLIFGVAALALARSLNQVGLLALESKQAAEVQAHVHSLLFEYGFSAELVEGETELPSEDGTITYQVVIEPMELENMEGLVLPDMFKIRVIASWEEDQQQQEVFAETYRYAPLYR